MVKKRFLVAILLVLVLLITSTKVFAGCCVGIIGCSRAFFQTECSALAAFDPSECEEIPDCDIVACCHDIPGMSKAQYRSTCEGMAEEVAMTYIKPFVTNPSAESAYAASLCEGAVPPCTYVNCEQANPTDCMCGSAVTSGSAQYCCAKDHSVFTSFGTCSQSASCRAQNFYNVYGRVESPDGVPIAGAEVKGPKNTVTDENGNFTLELIADDSRFTLRAIKNNTINITEQLHISGADLHDIIIVLDIPAVPVGPVEDCTNGKDDDGDQFFWDSEAQGLANAADKCDTDCNPALQKTVPEAYYNEAGEYESTEKNFCSDGFDNDCNGLTDCQEQVCRDNSPYCKNTFCGDGIIQFPNSQGKYEQCDYFSVENHDEPIRNATGDIIGNDSLCPGSCLPPDNPKECTCQYEAVCGNNVIDPPFEDCDGVFDAPRDRWLSINPGSNSACNTESSCGKPNSIRPCQCPPPQVCGNDVKEAPEECDGTDNAQCGGAECLPDCRCPPSEARCGDNLLQQGEDCDGVFDDMVGQWTEFKTRKYGCGKATCAVPKDVFNNHMDIFTGSNYEEYLNGLGVDAACKCKTECKQQPPGPDLQPIETARFKRQILLEWTDPCMNENAKNYNVHRCSGSSVEDCISNGFSVINDAPLGVAHNYTDSDFIGSTEDDPVYYCYRVEGLYDTLTDLPPDDQLDMFYSTLDTDIHCVKAGMEDCFRFRQSFPLAEEFCSDNKRSTCNDDNEIVQIDYDHDVLEPVDCDEDVETPYVCVGPYSQSHPQRPGLTQCVPQSICDYCNDPFGLFAYSSSSGISWETEPETASAMSLDAGMAPDFFPDSWMQQNRLYTSCFDLEDVCHMDYSYTTINKFFSYTVSRYTEPTCYDFNSLNACKKFNDTQGGGLCEWVWHPLYKELGIGVCRTNITDLQECDRCHDPRNKVFGRCDRETCALYGKCYYDREDGWQDYASLAEMSFDIPYLRADKVGDTYYKCENERYISCENYDSMEDCIGSHSPYSIEGSETRTSDAIIDVAGYWNTSIFEKTDGTNSLVTPSDDFFGFGKCQWGYRNERFYKIVDGEEVLDREVSNPAYYKCFKNSDGSPPVVETSGDPLSGDLFRTVKEYTKSDCGGFFPRTDAAPNYNLIEDVMDCRRDFTEPVTTIPHYGDEDAPMRIGASFTLPALVSDNSLDYSRYYPDTYACISDTEFTSEGQYYCYPRGKAEKSGQSNLINEKNIQLNLSYDFSEQGFQEGIHYITYFSEDISHNLEEVRSFPVYMDPNPPEVTVIFSNKSYELHEDVWRTNMTMDMTIGGGEDVTCDAKLFIGNVSVYPLQDIINEYNSSWEREYNDMPDETYIFWYRCVDSVGNKAEKNITLIIDGDKSITNPQPRGTLNQTSVVIRVETGTNSECRYRYSVEDLPDFWDNRTFDDDLFNSMTKFDVTGSEAEPATLHRSTVTLQNGYHRYYVKCRSLNDGSLHGNAGDQIRFAVDVQGPVSTHITNSVPYNDWYNKDIYVSLACGDVPITGMGLDWSFGCDKTYYCVGLDCKDYENQLREYEGPILFNKTQYLTYYSMDRGENEESPVENILFQIDKEPPEITVEFFEGELPASVLVMNRAYRVVVSSSKPFISPAIAQPMLTYISSPARFGGTVKLFPTDDPSVWEGVFFLENINANKGFEGDGIFTVTGTDYHNVSGSGSKTIYIDTKPPDAPVLEPSLEEPSRTSSAYQQLGYPVNYHDGVYYTNKPSLFLTGYTGEFLDMIAVTSSEGVDTEKIFTQTPATVVYNDTVISGFEGQHEIKIFGDITQRANSTLFVGFDSEKDTIGPMNEYTKYGMFYDITDLIYHGGDEQYTSVFIYPVIEESLALDRKILFYDQEYPSLWFGLDVPFELFKNTTFYLKSYDSSNNLVRYPEISAEVPYLTFFADPIPPSVIGHFPNDGSTSRNTFDLEVRVKEAAYQSGLFGEGVVMKVNGEELVPQIEHISELEEQDPDNYYYRIYQPFENLEDGVYDVSIDGTDLAMNPFDESSYSSHWTFEVDRHIPADPDFSLVGGFQDPLTGDRWYVNHSPDFIVDFSDESNPVTIVDVSMDDALTEGGAATCESTDYNVFLCHFTTPKTSSSQSGAFWADYGVVIKAFKTLADGTDSPEGSYGPFWFTVDDEAPDFDIMMNNRFRDNVNLSINAIVRNERHDLEARLDILGDSFFPIFSSHNGTFYYFVWEVPDYSKPYDEGPTDMRITLTDFAHNSNSKDLSVYVDLTAPNISDVTIDVSHTVKIGHELFTSDPDVTISGSFFPLDDDIYAVWVSPGDYDPLTGEFAEKKYADLKRDNTGVPRSFTVSVNLFDPTAGKKLKDPFPYNYMLINQINNMTLFAMDVAGHVSHRPLRVISDLAPPLPPTFCIGDEGLICVPPPEMPQQ